MTELRPGPLILFGSGETSSSGQKVFDWLFRQLNLRPRVAILETPAGFELNSQRVAQRIGDFLVERLQNYRPEVTLVPARRRETPWSPDAPELMVPLLDGDVIFLGPGSPSYAVRQLQDSLAWHVLRARHRLGAAVVLASAAAIAAGRYALPVYEIYKVGEDPHWKPGLDFLGDFGLPLVVVPHWNNAEGGAELDTSRCFMGQARFDALQEMLPSETTLLGLDEHTALAIDWETAGCYVLGQGSVTLIRHGVAEVFTRDQCFGLGELGIVAPQEFHAGIPPQVWQQVQAAAAGETVESAPPALVQELAQRREEARLRRDWAAADSLRAEIEAQGWRVQDTQHGPSLVRR